MLTHFVVLSCLAIAFVATSLRAETEDDVVKFPTDKLVSALQNKQLAADFKLPENFREVARAKGDLNNDGVEDLALILKFVPAKSKPEDDAPQAILLFLGDKEKTYKLWKTGANHFLTNRSNRMTADGVGSFAIKKGVLTIQSDVAMSMGGWSAGGCTQKWRTEKDSDKLRLIGLTVDNIDRKCACGTTVDTNFVTGAEVDTSDRKKNGDQGKSTTKKKKGTPKTILWDEFDYEKYCEGGE